MTISVNCLNNFLFNCLKLVNKERTLIIICTELNNRFTEIKKGSVCEN